MGNNYLRTWATGNYFVPEDDYNVLLDIASQDPVKSGWGVINAWVMTRRFNSDDKVDKLSSNLIKIKESKYKIQPNPANTSFMLSNASDIDLIIVTNILGQDVLTIKNFEINEITIDVSSLKKGIYLIRLKNAKSQEFSVEKLIIE